MEALAAGYRRSRSQEYGGLWLEAVQTPCGLYGGEGVIEAAWEEGLTACHIDLTASMKGLQRHISTLSYFEVGRAVHWQIRSALHSSALRLERA